MKLPTLYIPIIHKDSKHQMLSTKRIKSITSILPTMQEIDAHLMLEKKYVKEIKDYKPVPYSITLNKEEYSKIQADLYKAHQGYKSEVVYLMFSSQGAPIIKILSE